MNEQAQLLALMQLLEQYAAGNVDSQGSRGFGSADQSNSGTSAAGGNMSMGLSNAAIAANLGAQLGQSPEMGQLAGLLGLASAMSNPNATLGSVAPAALSVAGLGPLATVASFANNGVTASNVLGLLGMTVNPGFGLLGLANSIAGNPLGASFGGLGETLGNPGSMGLASEAGISFGEQIANSLDQGQTEGGYDTEAMDGLVGAIMGETEGSFDSGDDGDDGDSGSDGDSGGGYW